MHYTIIPAALISALLLTFIFSLFSKRPLRSFFIFFLLIFLLTWTGQLWITPFGPVTWGISWYPLLLVALFFSLLIMALIPPEPAPRVDKPEPADAPLIILGSFLWIIFLLLIIAIVVGYYRLPHPL